MGVDGVWSGEALGDGYALAVGMGWVMCCWTADRCGMDVGLLRL